MFRILAFLPALLAPAADSAPIPRRLPPEGLPIPPAIEKELREATETLRKRFEQLQPNWRKWDESGAGQDAGDILIFVKAVDFAIRHREFYAEKDFETARKLLAEGNRRCDLLAKNERPWRTQKGRVIRGYLSQIDDSPQPVGFEIPEEVKLGDEVKEFHRPNTLYVWLHGRGDKQTDLHFIQDRMTKAGQIQPKGAIVMHPFGRHCLGFKSAGEGDVLEACDLASESYDVNERKMVLIGFSMGGAGSWHLGAHYAPKWAAIAPGAGFAETQRYQKLDPAKVPWYERTLWGQYDAPAYVRNLLDRPVIAYSGEIDPQKQAADVMAEAFAGEGEKLTHLIGPGMPHKYHPDSLKEILSFTATACERVAVKTPSHVRIQTRTLRYPDLALSLDGRVPIQVMGLEEHWRDSRIDAEIPDEGPLRIKTQNISAFRLESPPFKAGRKCVIDGQELTLANDAPVRFLVADELPPNNFFHRKGGRWAPASLEEFMMKRLGKSPYCQGPIDDAFARFPFLVVTPTGKCRSPGVQKWVEFELAHFLDRWRATFRGEARVKKDVDVTPSDLTDHQHLVLWGDDQSNQLIAKFNRGLPIRWEGKEIVVGTQTFSAADHVPMLICRKPLELTEGGQFPTYIVLNSGPTFREAHDATNSQQNPKLPDWAIVDLSQPPDDRSPGKIVAADFFDEEWKLKPLKPPAP